MLMRHQSQLVLHFHSAAANALSQKPHDWNNSLGDEINCLAEMGVKNAECVRSWSENIISVSTDAG